MWCTLHSLWLVHTLSQNCFLSLLSLWRGFIDWVQILFLIIFLQSVLYLTWRLHEKEQADERRLRLQNEPGDRNGHVRWVKPLISVGVLRDFRLKIKCLMVGTCSKTIGQQIRSSSNISFSAASTYPFLCLNPDILQYLYLS